MDREFINEKIGTISDAGLAAYDAAMTNAWKNAAREFGASSATDAEIATGKVRHDERTLSGRGKLHRQLRSKALAMVAQEAAENPAGTVGR